MSEIKSEGQIALVTGATRGIGAAIAQELKAAGMTVIGTATSAEGAVKITAAGIDGVVLNVTTLQLLTRSSKKS
jgi:3-oxoacyl-[acyl-carrier protein] reductase